MRGELLEIIVPLALILGGTALFLHITGANAYREMERRQARFRELSEAYGDVPRVHPEAMTPARVTRGGAASVGASGGTRTEAIARSHGLVK